MSSTLPLAESAAMQAPTGHDVDVITVGAGMGGIYAVHRLREQGLSVLGFEGGSGVGGVWFHNRYPGARVDIESYFYAYYFSDELVRDWVWTERYPAQPEILRYLNHVADRFRIKPHFRFNTWVRSAQWDPAIDRYRVTSSAGETFTCRFLMMTSGNLSEARKPRFAGLDNFKGEWVQTSHWPENGVDWKGRRVAVIGTGASGVQVIPELAKSAAHLYVLQRTPNYSVPARNGPIDQVRYEAIKANPQQTWSEMLATRQGSLRLQKTQPAGSLTEQQQRESLEQCWAYGGQAMNAVFSDQGATEDSNRLVSEFVRSKTRELVQDPIVAEQLTSIPYPIGTRRLGVDSGYYETFNRPNVSLVDLREEPIECITETGIRTQKRHIELDLIVFALGFHAFTGALDSAGIRNAEGRAPTDYWKHGPRTYLGLMTEGFPNLFLPTGPGSPSVLANMLAGNVQNLDWIADCIRYMDDRGLRRVAPHSHGIDDWTLRVQEVAPKLRLNVDNYMVHVNADDGKRIFIPYAGGLDRYIAHVTQVSAEGYPGLCFQ